MIFFGFSGKPESDNMDDEDVQCVLLSVRNLLSSQTVLAASDDRRAEAPDKRPSLSDLSFHIFTCSSSTSD